MDAHMDGLKKERYFSKCLTYRTNLVALLDGAEFMELFPELLGFVLSAKIEKPVTYQNNTPVLTLVEWCTTRTKEVCYHKGPSSPQKIDI